MRPLLARQRAAILEDGHVLEARISFQIQDTLGIGFEDALDLLILHAAEPSVVVGRFNDDLVSAHCAHAVVNAFRSARSFTLDSIQGIEMRDDAHLGGSVGRQLEQHRAGGGLRRAERASRVGRGTFPLRAHDNPTIGDGVLTQLHGGIQKPVRSRT